VSIIAGSLGVGVDLGNDRANGHSRKNGEIVSERRHDNVMGQEKAMFSSQTYQCYATTGSFI
jgi:hypothetical protein